MEEKKVIPFSNGADFMFWHNNNCAKCSKYESESTTEDKASCKMAYHLDLGTVLGDMPLKFAKMIGGNYVEGSSYFKLAKNCKQFT